MAQLKDDVVALAREDTVRALTDRWAMIEREIAALPQSLASRDDMDIVASRLDNMHQVIRDLPGSLSTDTLETELRALAVAVEQLATQDSGGFDADARYAMESRLDEISRAISALPASPPPADPADALAIERIEARIAALATQMDQMTVDMAAPDYDARFDAIANQIDALRAQSAIPAGIPGEAIDALSARIEEIAGAVEELGHVGERQARATPELAQELNQRLAAIDSQLQTTTAMAERSHEGVMASLDNRMTELAHLIDQGERAQAAVPSIGQMEERLEEIARSLADGATAAPAGVDHLEAQIARLTESLGSVPASAPDQDSVLAAARMAAEEAVARTASQGGEAPQALTRLADDLGALETLARETDNRNAQTFEAIHDTLLKVVDHLAGLESVMRPPADAPRTPDEPDVPETVHIPDAPSLALEDERRPSEPVSPAQAAARAAMAALGDARASEPPPGADGSKSILRNMTGRFSRSRESDRSSAWEQAAEGAPSEAPALVVEDHPIEPTSEQVGLADIMARVRQERSGDQEGDTAGGEPQATADTGKSDFIAAARRAAKAAAADAQVSAPNGGKPSDAGTRTSLASILARRRRPILMGAGAILLALLSVPLIRGFLLAPDVNDQIAAEREPAAIVETMPEAANGPLAEPFLADAGDQAEPGPVAPRDVTDTPNVLGGAPDPSLTVLPGADAVTPLATEAAIGFEDGVDAAAPELGPVVDAVLTAPVASDLGLPAIPEGIGSIALREAASGGDPLALYVVGDWHMSEAGGGDMASALAWYEKSAEMGFAPAQYRAGNFSEKGFGTERDYQAAKTWYQLAAEQGNASAMHNLAVLFASGVDGEADFDSAARWFMRAAELGVRDSQFNLGILSAKGQGTDQDLIESYKWFALAAQSGDADAAAKRDEVAAVLRPDQLETARGATALWRARDVDQAANVVAVPDAWRSDAERTAATGELSADDMQQAVRNIQAILNNNGYDAGPVDGIMGGKTREAILAFQRDNGLEATGAVDQPLVEKLLQMNAANG